MNRLERKPIKNRRYTEKIVRKYCRSLGISLKTRSYELNKLLMGEIFKLHTAGKSSKEIADHLAGAGFTKLNGNQFNYAEIWRILKRNGKEPVRKDRSGHIIEEIRDLSDKRYRPRTIARKLNAMGLRTATGVRFKIHHVTHYLYKIRKMGAQQQE